MRRERHERPLQGIEAWLQGLDPWEEEEDSYGARVDERELRQDERPLVRDRKDIPSVRLHQLQVGDVFLRLGPEFRTDKFRCTHMIREDSRGELFILAVQA